jgi:ankyrin repeat protein
MEDLPNKSWHPTPVGRVVTFCRPWPGVGALFRSAFFGAAIMKGTQNATSVTMPLLRITFAMALMLSWVLVALGGEIHDAARVGDVEKVNALLTMKPELANDKDDAGMTALHVAAREGQKDVARLLLRHKADVNGIARSNFTPLHWAVWRDDVEMVELLLQHKADINVTCNEGHAPLHVAVGRRPSNRVMVALLLAHEADVHATGKNLEAPLHVAAREGHKEAAELLLIQGADVNSSDKTGTPLFWAVFYDRKEVAELLVTHGADVDAKAHQGWTPLHKASSDGLTELAELLLAHKADVHARTDAGLTPLHQAAFSGHKELTELLLAHKADVNARSVVRWTPLGVALDRRQRFARSLDPAEREAHLRRYDEVIAVLRRHGGRR